VHVVPQISFITPRNGSAEAMNGSVMRRTTKTEELERILQRSKAKRNLTSQRRHIEMQLNVQLKVEIARII